MNNAESTEWLRDVTQVIEEATKEAKPGATVNVTITYAPVAVTNIDNRQVHIYSERSAPRVQSLCHPSRQQLTGYSAQLAGMTEAERNALWDSQNDNNFIY